MWRAALRPLATAADAVAARSAAVASSSACSATAHHTHRSGGAAFRRGGVRAFAADAADDDAAAPEDATLSPRVDKLVADILALNLLEVAELTDVLQKRLGVGPLSFAAAGAAPAAAAAAAPAAADAAAAPPAEAKTAFDVKLAGFDADAKIKVIKEVRAATGLGLKEAKELVEKAPCVIKGGLKQVDADELRAKLEAAGGKVAVE